VIRAVTLDAYGTVFDFESHLPAVAGDVLAAERVERLSARELADAWGAHFGALYEEFGRTYRAGARAFKTVAELTAEALAAAYRQHGLERDPWPGTEIWLRCLRAVEPFPEVGATLQALAGRFALAMISDTDDDIIAPALKRIKGPFRFVLTSEQVRAYKQDPRATLFRRALAELDLAAGEVLHVGDSAADVAGAKAAGMPVAWVNRAGRKLPASCPRPDWEIPDLAALPEIVESRS